MQIQIIGRAVAVLMVLSAIACTTYRPLPVHEPAPPKVQGRVYPLRGMPPPTELPEAQETLYAYANSYMAHVETLTGASYNAADATMLGGLVGTAGGLTKSPEAAIAGTVIAGGAGIFAQRYALPVQISSYVGASQAMECMATVLIYGKGPDVTEAWEEEVDAPTNGQIDFAFLNARIDQVRRKLRASLASIDVSKADVAALKTSLTDQIEAERKARKAREDKAAAEQAKATAAAALKQKVAEADSAAGGRKSTTGARAQTSAEISAQYAVDQAQLAIVEAAVAVKRADRAVIHTSLAACANAY